MGPPGTRGIIGEVGPEVLSHYAAKSVCKAHKKEPDENVC